MLKFIIKYFVLILRGFSVGSVNTLKDIRKTLKKVAYISAFFLASTRKRDVDFARRVYVIFKGTVFFRICCFYP